MPADLPARDAASAVALTAETVAAVAKLYVNTALDDLERDIAAKIRRLRRSIEEELSGPDPFAALLKAVSAIDGGTDG